MGFSKLVDRDDVVAAPTVVSSVSEEAEAPVDDDQLVGQVSRSIDTEAKLRAFITNLTQALIKQGGSARSAVQMAVGIKPASEAMNVLSDYESEDDSHLFPQQQAPAE